MLVFAFLVVLGTITSVGCGDQGLESPVAPSPVTTVNPEVPPNTNTTNRSYIDSRGFALDAGTPSNMTGGVAIIIPAKYKGGTLDVKVEVTQPEECVLRVFVGKLNPAGQIAKVGDFHMVTVNGRVSEINVPFSSEDGDYRLVLQRYSSPEVVRGSYTVYHITE